MSKFILLPCLFIAAICAVNTQAAAVEDKRSLLDMAAKLYASAWETFLPDSTKETCRGLGWVDGPTQSGRKRRYVSDVAKIEKRGFFDNFVPTGLAHAMGAFHQGVFPPSMEAAFCTTLGMVKPGAAEPATPQITGVFGTYRNQKVLVTAAGQVYDLSANLLGNTQTIGPIQYVAQ